jgi:hypothetical protein
LDLPTISLNFDLFLRCNPSINLQVGAPEDSNFTQAQTLIVVAALNLGFYVSIADDGGPQAAFGRNDVNLYCEIYVDSMKLLVLIPRIRPSIVSVRSRLQAISPASSQIQQSHYMVIQEEVW